MHRTITALLLLTLLGRPAASQQEPPFIAEQDPLTLTSDARSTALRDHAVIARRFE